MKLWKLLIDWLWTKPDYYAITHEEAEKYLEAVAHYCYECKTGFKTKGAAATHKRFKHNT